MTGSFGVSLAAVCVALAASPAFGQAQDAPAPASGAAEPARVDILNYRVEGNSVLSRIEIERAVYPFLGPGRTTDDVERARAALEKVYRDRGFQTVAVRIPQQEVRKGIVRLEVTELKIGRLRVTGADWYSPMRIKARAPSLAEGKVPNYNEVSADIAALNKSRDRVIAPALRAGETPGTVDVDLEVTDSIPASATIELNDRYSSRTRRLRASASVTYSNLWQRDHSLSVQGQLTPEDPGESWLVSASYVAPIAGTPLTLVAYGVHSDSDIAAVGGINVIGKGDIVGLRAIYSIPGDGIYQNVTAGIDYKSFGENLLIGSDSASTPIDYVPLSLAYGLNYRGQRAEIDFTTSLNMGLRGLDATEAEFRRKRSRASANWFYLRSELGLLYRMPGGFDLSVRMAGQLAGEPLISNEQFAIGGFDSVRGYLESQALGDMGYSQQIELVAPSLLNRGVFRDFRPFLFTDMGVTRIIDPLAFGGEVDDGTVLASAGGGIRLRAFEHLNIAALLAVPLRNEASVPTDVDGVRGQFRLWLSF